MPSASATAKKEAKLEHILEAAGKLFAYTDFQSVLMDDIASEAGVGKGTLYNFFSSKEELYFSIIRTRMEHLLSLLEQAYDNRNDALQNLRSFIIHLHKFMSKHPYFYLIWKKEEHTLDRNSNRDISGLQKRIHRLIKRIVSQGIREGVFREKINEELVTHFILGMVDSLKKNRSTIYEKEEAIEVLLHILIQGIGKEGT